MRNSIVVPVFNKSSLTKRCFESLLAHSSEQTRSLFVIDNASSDDTPEVLENFKSQFEAKSWRFEILSNQKNVGFGRAMNQGAKLVETEFVTLLNNDTWLMKNWDAVLLRRAVEISVDMIAPFAYENTFMISDMEGLARAYVERNRGKWKREWSSILMMFKTESFRRVGMFDERFFVTYEDTDLRERMKREGMSFAQIGDAFIWHQSMGTREGGALPSGYEVEGKKLFIEKWGFDPSSRESGKLQKLKRSWQKFKNRRGLF